MKQIKFYSKQLLIFLGSILIFSLFLSLLQYINLLNTNIIHILSMAFIVILNLILGLICGKNAESKGYLEGLKISSLFLLILLFLDIIFFQSSFQLSRILYYLLLIVTIVVGSMIGINKKDK